MATKSIYGVSDYIAETRRLRAENDRLRHELENLQRQWLDEHDDVIRNEERAKLAEAVSEANLQLYVALGTSE